MNFNEWFAKNYDNETLPTTMDGSWFHDHHLPMVVSCVCCGTTMALPSACLIEDELGWNIFCSDCNPKN